VLELIELEIHLSVVSFFVGSMQSFSTTIFSASVCDEKMISNDAFSKVNDL
jgi:hypothetical protein